MVHRSGCAWRIYQLTLRCTLTEHKKIRNYVFRDTGHGSYQVAVCFQKVVGFHSQRLGGIPLTTIGKVFFFSLPMFQLRSLQISYTEFHENHTMNVESTDLNSVTAMSKEWLSLFRFSRNSRSRLTILWTTPAPNFIQIGRKIFKILMKCHLHP